MTGMLRRLLQLANSYLVIARSRVFDAGYYRQNNPDLRWFSVAPLLHYLLAGSREKRNPSPYFNIEYYLEDNPDLAESDIEPFTHYLAHGGREGRNPSVRFDTAHYVRTYPDVLRSHLNPLSHFIRHGQDEGRRSLPASGQVLYYAPTGPQHSVLRSILFLASSHDPHTVRYRVHQLIPHFTARGIACYVTDESAQTGDVEACDPDLLFLCRVPCHAHLRSTLEQARRRGKAIVFDIDDLILDPSFLGYIHFVLRGTHELFRDYVKLTRWLRQSLLRADAVTCSTSHLAAILARFGKPVEVVPNNLSDEILARIASQAGSHSARPGCTIGYFSGTRSHQRDFAEVAAPLRQVLQSELQVRLLIVGHLDLDPSFDAFADRIDRKSRVPYEEMIDLMGQIDINLAPLEPDNPFTACKSELKIFEAAAHGVPTIASAVGAAGAAIDHGRSGLLAASPADWLECLLLLVRNPEVRAAIGEAARLEIVPRFTARAAAERAIAACETALANSRKPWRLLSAELPQVLFISGGPPACRRYRCMHAQDQLRAAGIPSDVFSLDEIRDWTLLPPAKIIILHRVPHDAEVGAFIATRRAAGAILLFDSDDLVFLPGIERHVHALRDMKRDELALYSDGLRRYRETLRQCDAGIASTPVIRDAMAEIVPTVYLHRNAPGLDLLARSEEAMATRHGRHHIVIGYHSGTNTHNGDFARIAAPLARLMTLHPSIHLRVVGPLHIPDTLAAFSDRVETAPLVDWRDLPREVAATDINVAPLEDNPFCAAKSDLKYFEAALVRVPTVASRVGEFAANLRDGVTGFLADTEEEWFAKLDALVCDPALRERIAAAAERDVLARLAPPVKGAELRAILLQVLARARDARALSLDWYLQAPFEGSGGYTNIFRFGRLLAAMGYRVRFLMQKTAHFSHLSDTAILEYVRKHFRSEGIELAVGHDQSVRADVAIATGWPTALKVAEIQDVRRKMYFVQDYEADFYEAGSANFDQARATYDFGFRMVTLGHRLAERLNSENRARRAMGFDFAADRDLFRPGADRKPDVPVRIIFYARPETPRRGFPLGMAALELVHRRHGRKVEIALYGSKLLAHQAIPFPFTDLGVLKPGELAREFARSHIGVSFSRSNFSLVPLEMMATGCAVVELRSANTAHVLEDGVNALLADEDAESVARTMDRLIEDSALRDHIAAGGLAYADRFSWERSAQAVDEAIRAALLESTCLQPHIAPEQP